MCFQRIRRSIPCTINRLLTSCFMYPNTKAAIICCICLFRFGSYFKWFRFDPIRSLPFFPIPTSQMAQNWTEPQDNNEHFHMTLYYNSYILSILKVVYVDVHVVILLYTCQHTLFVWIIMGKKVNFKKLHNLATSFVSESFSKIVYEL